MAIHPSASIDPTAKIDHSVSIGAYTIIGPHVTIGKNCIIGPHVIIDCWTRIGARNRIYQFATLGGACQDRKYKDEETWLEIGDDNIIRESCTLHRGTTQDRALTTIGNSNLFMVNTHIAHDCVIGDHCVFANNVSLAGHVKIDDFVIIGGQTAVHQFCQIGSYAMIGGVSSVYKDVVAYVMAQGNPCAVHGINAEGMRRRGASPEAITAIKQAFKIVFREGLTKTEAIHKLTSELLPVHHEIRLVIDSLANSRRGVAR